MMLHEWPHCAFIWLYLINRKERQRINLSAKIQVVVFYSLAWAVWSYLNWNINSQIYRRDAYSYFQRWIPHTVSNKNIHLPLFEIGMFFFADISGTTWAIKKFSASICILVWRAFKWKSFWKPVTKSVDICKNAVLTEKVSYWKKSAILKNSKTFIHGSKV